MPVLSISDASARPVRVTLAVEGLSCGGGGALTAERALARVPGVVRAYVNPATEMAYVEYSPAACSPEQLRAALTAEGFDAAPPEATRRMADITSDLAPNVRAADHDCCAAPARPEAARTDRLLRRPLSFRWRVVAFGLIATLVLGVGLWLALPHQPAAAAARYSVDLSMAGFQPAALDVPAGTAVTVRLTNVDSPFHGITNGALHQFAIDEIGLDVRLDARQVQVITLPPMQPGTYTFYCDVCCGGKANKTMRGTLQVH